MKLITTVFCENNVKTINIDIGWSSGGGAYFTVNALFRISSIRQSSFTVSCTASQELEPVPAVIGCKAVYPWTGHHIVIELTYRAKKPYTLRFATLGKSESPFYLTCTFLGCGRKPEYLEGTCT